MCRLVQLFVVLFFSFIGAQRFFLREENSLVDIDQLEHLRCGAPPCIDMDLASCDVINSRNCDGGACLEASGGSELYCDISEQLENVRAQYPVCKRANDGWRDTEFFQVACYGRLVCSSYCEPDGEGGMVCSYNDSYPAYSEPQHMVQACTPSGQRCPGGGGGGYIADREFNRYQLIASANGL